MAINTPKHYRNLVIYEIYVRNHSEGGTLAEVQRDLGRIRSMGVDIIWFMPIHPIGELRRKGALGSPYSIRNYRAINPEYGTENDFRALCREASELGMRVMIDVVYNHTSHDCNLVTEHPEWYNVDEKGNPVTTVPQWWDVIDLAHRSPALWDYLSDSLKYWVNMGVSGFRCDVAPLVPMDFWHKARHAVDEVRPDVIWLAESIHAHWVCSRRREGLRAHSDSEIHHAFDLSYDYDIWPIWERAVAHPTHENLRLYMSALQYQSAVLPGHAIKMRCVENHDQIRIRERAPDRDKALAWTAFQAFNEGAFLIYGGQESEAVSVPSLFDNDKIQWGNYPLQAFLTSLSALKKDPIQVEGHFTPLGSWPALTAVWHTAEQGLFGLFNVAGSAEPVHTPLPHGSYPDLLGGPDIEVREGAVIMSGPAAVVRYKGQLNLAPYMEQSLLL